MENGKSFSEKVGDFFTGGTATTEPNTVEQPSTVEQVPDYLLEIGKRTPVNVTGKGEYQGEHKMRFYGVTPLPGGTDKDGKKTNGLTICLNFELTELRTDTHCYLFCEEKPVYGLKSVANLQLEFAKFRALELIKLGVASLPQHSQLFATLAQHGWTIANISNKDKFKGSKIVSKLFYILDGSGLMEWFQGEAKFDINALKGKVVDAKISSGGQLMSITGQEKGEKVSVQEATPLEDAGVADYSLNFG